MLLRGRKISLLGKNKNRYVIGISLYKNIVSGL
jgi:hypothetical protein